MLVLSTPHDEIRYVYHTYNYFQTIERGFFNDLDKFLSSNLNCLKTFNFDYQHFHFLFIGVEESNLFKLKALFLPYSFKRILFTPK